MEEGEGKEGLRIVKDGAAKGEANDKGGEEAIDVSDLSGGAVLKLEVQVPLVAFEGNFESALARLVDVRDAIEDWGEYLSAGDAPAWVLYGRIHSEVEVVYAALCEFLNRRNLDGEGDDDGSTREGGKVGGES